MKYDLMSLHKRVPDSRNPLSLLNRFTKEELNYPHFSDVSEEVFNFWLNMHGKRAKTRILSRFRPRIPLLQYLKQNGYCISGTLAKLNWYKITSSKGAFPKNSLHGEGFDVYLPPSPKLINHFSDTPLKKRKELVPLEDALFLCDSSLTPEEAKERIKALKLTSKVSIKGDSWKVPANLPYDL